MLASRTPEQRTTARLATLLPLNHPRSVHEGRRRVGPYEIVTGDWAKVAVSPSFPPDAFDFVVTFEVPEHLPRIGEELALIRTVLKPGGHLFVSVPNSESFVAKAMGKH
jgi:SAM-dependent methyltransferase